MRKNGHINSTSTTLAEIAYTMTKNPIIGLIVLFSLVDIVKGYRNCWQRGFVYYIDIHNDVSLAGGSVCFTSLRHCLCFFINMKIAGRKTQYKKVSY